MIFFMTDLLEQDILAQSGIQVKSAETPDSRTAGRFNGGNAGKRKAGRQNAVPSSMFQVMQARKGKW
jgi:hypothetical protein